MVEHHDGPGQCRQVACDDEPTRISIDREKFVFLAISAARLA